MARRTAVAVDRLTKCGGCGNPVREKGATVCRECLENAERRQARQKSRKSCGLQMGSGGFY